MEKEQTILWKANHSAVRKNYINDMSKKTKPINVAAIDIGSNGARLLIKRFDPDNAIEMQEVQCNFQVKPWKDKERRTITF